MLGLRSALSEVTTDRSWETGEEAVRVTWLYQYKDANMHQ